MSLFSWLPDSNRSNPGKRRGKPTPPLKRIGYRLTLEALEDRTLLSSYTAASVSELIAAIATANTAGGANTITLTAPTTSPYDLTSVNNTTDGPTGLPVISGGSRKGGGANNLTIIGNGDILERSTAAGTPAFRLFDVGSKASLTLVNLTLQNGLAFGGGTAAEGGAIYNQSTLVLDGVTIQDNNASGAPGATVNGRKSPLPGADAAGGAIWSNGSLTTKNGTILQDNTARGGDGGLNSTYPTIQGTGGNAYGGAVYLAGGSAKLGDTNISGNLAWPGQDKDGNSVSYSQGGGIDIAAGTVSVTGGSISENTARNGGALYCAASTTTTITGGNNFFDNEAAESGGAIYNLGTLTVSGCTFSFNYADAETIYFFASQGGGAIYNNGSLTVNGNSTLSDNFAYGATADNAGGSGGGILNYTSGVATVTDSTLSDNSADDSGGGIANLASMTVTSCSLTGNSANTIYAPSGGAIISDGTLTVRDSAFSNNTAYDGAGIECGGMTTISGCTFSSNKAYVGGAIDCNGTISISNCTFTDNGAGAKGGAIFNEGTLTISGCTLTGNSAAVDAGGIFSYNAVVDLSNSTLGANSPDNIVGGYVDQGGNTFY